MAHVDSERKARLINKINEAMSDLGVRLKFDAKVLCKKTTLKIEVFGCTENLVENYIETAKAKLNEAIELECDSADTYQQRIDRALNLCEFNPLFLNLNNISDYFTGQALEIVQGAKDALRSEYYTSGDTHSTYDIAYAYALEIGGTRKGFSLLK